MWEYLSILTDYEKIIQVGGLWLLLLVIFAETGLLVGFFLPGDNLILFSGIICKVKPELLGLSYFPLVSLMFFAAVLGYFTGYWFGYKTGSKLYARKDSFFFKQKHLEATNKVYEKYGGNKTIVIARFLPYIRTFAPIIAGVLKKNFKSFVVYNLIGAFLWIVGLTAIGYALGEIFPNIMDYMGYIFTALIIITAIPFIRLLLKR